MCRRVFAYAIAMAIAFVLTFGCTSDSNKVVKRSRGRSYEIAVIPKATTYDFWKAVRAGAEQAGKKFGVEILWKGPLTEGDVEGQINVVQDFISKRVDGICLAPIDSQALMAVVRQAREEDIPVVIYDSGLESDADVISTIATDNYRAGTIAARHMGQILNGEGNVVVLRYTPGSQSTELRERGFLEILDKEFPNISVISENEYAGPTAETALEAAERLLGKYSAEVDGIFTPCEHVTVGMLQALVDAELAGKVKFVGFDSNPRLVQALRDQQLHGLVLQDPVKMASIAVEKMVDHLSGTPVEKIVSSGEMLATPENCEQLEIKQLLEPKLD